MAFESFRDFVARLDRAGELKRIAQPVATELIARPVQRAAIRAESFSRCVKGNFI